MPTPQEAIDYAKRFIGNMPVDDTEMKLRILNDASDLIWHAAPWRWSVGALDIVTLQNDQQDYEVNEPTDFNDLLFCYLTDGQQKWDVQVAGALPETQVMKGQPSAVSLEGDATLRFLPVPTGYGDAVYALTWYKKLSPEITADNLTTDWETTTGAGAWGHVFQAFVLYYAMQFANYPKAGGVTFMDGKAQYTGQLGVAMALLDRMIASEPKFLDSLGREVEN